MDDPDPLERFKGRLSPENAETFDDIVARIKSGDRETIDAVGEELQKLTAPSPSAVPGLGTESDWYVVRVELESGMGQEFNPPPGRDVLISPQHTFRGAPLHH